MKHVNEGTVRAYFDDTLSTAEHAEVQEHLAQCERCAARAALVEQRGRRVQSLLAGLTPETGIEPASARVARQELETYIRQKEERRMVHNPFSKRYRPAWAVGLLVMLIVITLTVPPVRTMAGNLLSLFRVQKVEFAEIDPETLPDEQALELAAPAIERMFEEHVTYEIEGERGFVDEAGARERADFSLRLPAGREATRYEWTPPVHLALEIDAAQWRALFGELGYGDVNLPDSLDGKTITVEFAGMLEAEYGTCGGPGSPDDPCLSLLQLPNPTFSAPDKLDVEALGRLYLGLLGIPESEIEALSARIDWTTTLVVPLPRTQDLTQTTVMVDGVEATLVHSRHADARPSQYLLTWTQGDMVYAIRGTGDPAEALALAELLE